MFKAAIWANKKSDDTFTLWATHAPDYEIPSNLAEGMLRLINYGGLSSITPGTGTFLCSIKDVSREFQLGVMFLDGYISWSIDNVEDLFEAEFPELIKFEEKVETRTFVIPTYLLSYFLNGEFAGLDEKEFELIESFLFVNQINTTKGHFTYDNSEPYFSWDSDLSEVGGSVVEIQWVENNEE